jgi:hypothetical protein
MSKESKKPHISRGEQIRHIKKEGRTFFKRPEPQSRVREMEHERSGEYKYKQALPENKGKRGDD